MSTETIVALLAAVVAGNTYSLWCLWRLYYHASDSLHSSAHVARALSDMTRTHAEQLQELETWRKRVGVGLPERLK